MELKKNNTQFKILKLFGPSIVKVKLPEEIINKL